MSTPEWFSILTLPVFTTKLHSALLLFSALLLIFYSLSVRIVTLCQCCEKQHFWKCWPNTLWVVPIYTLECWNLLYWYWFLDFKFTVLL